MSKYLKYNSKKENNANANNIDTNNIAGTNNIQNATKGKKSTETAKTFVPEANNKVDPNIYSELKKAQPILSKVSDDSNKKAQAILEKTVNVADAIGQKVNNVGVSIKDWWKENTKDLTKIKTENVLNKYDKFLSTVTDDERTEMESFKIGNDYDFDTSLNELYSKKTDLEKQLTKDNTYTGRLTEYETNLLQNQLEENDKEISKLERYKKIVEVDNSMAEYNAYNTYGTQEEKDAFNEAFSHSEDSLGERALTGATNVVVKTVNEIPTAIDQMHEVGNYNYGTEKIEELQQMYANGKISKDEMMESLEHWKNYIEEFKASEDGVSAKINEISNQLNANEYFNANKGEIIALQVADSTEQFLLHFVLGKAMTNGLGINKGLEPNDFEKIGQGVYEDQLLNAGKDIARTTGQSIKNFSTSQLMELGKAQIGDIARDELIEMGKEFALNQTAGNISTITMSAFSLQEKFNQLRKEGVDVETATKNSLLTGIVSYLTEKIGMDNFVNKVMNGAGTQVLGHLINSTASQFLSEGGEELVEGLIDPVIDYATLGKPLKVDGKELLTSFLVGGLSGGLTGFAGSINANIGNSVNNLFVPKFDIENKQQYNMLQQEIDLLREDIDSMDADESNYAYKLINEAKNAQKVFEEKSLVSMATSFPSDFVETTNKAQDKQAVVDALVPEVENEINFNNKLNETENMVNESIELLNSSEEENFVTNNLARIKDTIRKIASKAFDSNNNIKDLSTQLKEIKMDKNYGMGVANVGESLNFAKVGDNILFSQKTINKINNVDGISDEKIASLINNIGDKVVLGFDYTDINGNVDDDRKGFVLEDNGNIYILGIKYNNYNDAEIETLTTIHQKDNIARFLSNKKDSELYKNKKSSDFLDRVLFSTESLSSSTTNNNISNNLNNVNKQKQYDIIQATNPRDDSINPQATWITSPEDVKTYLEAVTEDETIETGITPDFTAEDIKKALDTGKITVYSTYPIENGVFVTPSKMEAESYGVQRPEGVYSKEVSLDDVAWIDGFEGQYANVSENESEDNNWDYGAKNVREVDIPMTTEDGEVSKAVATLANSVRINDEYANKLRDQVLNGERVKKRTVIKNVVNQAVDYIRENGIEKSYNDFVRSDSFSKSHLNFTIGLCLLDEMNNQGLTKTKAYDGVVNKLIRMDSQFGLGLRMAGEVQNMTPQGQIVSIQSEVERIQNGLNERFGEGKYNIKIDADLLEQFVNAEGDAKIELGDKLAQSIADQIPPSPLERINAYRHMSMLFNPRTWIKNYLSNTVFGYINEANRAVRMVGESIAQKINPEVERQAGVTFSKDLISKAGEYFDKTHSGVFNGKYSNIDAGDVLSNTKFGQQVSEKRDMFTSKFMKTLEKIQSKGLSDRPAMRRAFSKTMAGYLSVNNLTFETATEEQLAKASEFAYAEALKATFNTDNEIANAIIAFEKNTFKNNKVANGAVRVVVDSFIPFKRTPLNLIKTGAKFSPVQLAKSLTYDLYQLKTGKITANQFIDGISSGLTGSGIFLVGALLSHLGLFRTKDDDKDRKKYFDQENGEQDYAIVMDNGTYTIDWLDPIIVPMAMGAEFSKYLDDGTINAENLINIATSLADPMFETSMLSGISNNLKNYEMGSSAWWGKIIQNTITGYASQFVPTLGGAIARTIDDTRRISSSREGALKTVGVKTINKIPGASTLNNPYINREGQEEKNEDLGLGFAGRAVLNLLSPGYYSSNEIDDYDSELYRLYNKTGAVEVFPSASKTSLDYDNKNYKFTDDEYEKWNRTRWSTEKDIVDSFIDSDDYKNMNDSERAKTIERLRSYAGDVAKDDFLKEKGIKYDDSSFNKQQEAIGKGMDIYKYFLTKDFYDGLSTKNGDTPKNDYIDYLKDSNLSDEQKQYMYTLEYGDSKVYQNIEKMGFDNKTKFSMYEILADTIADKDENGKTISNSKARKVAEEYNKIGVLQDVLDYIKDNDIKPSEMGLSKTVYEELTGTSKKKKTKTSKSSYATAYKKIMKGVKTNNKATTFKSVQSTSGSNKTSYASSYKKVFGQKTTDSSIVTCPNCRNRVSPVNGKCPICGNNL